MGKNITFASNKPLSATDLNGLVQDGQMVTADGENAVDASIMSKKLVVNELDKKLDKDKLIRNTTVVVGLESSGYTIGQVDVFIAKNDSVEGKISAAIDDLPSTGGEIKLLEGTYTFLNTLGIERHNINLTGCGLNTIITSSSAHTIVLNGGNIQISNLKIDNASDGQGLLNNYNHNQEKGDVWVSNCWINRYFHQTEVNAAAVTGKSFISNCYSPKNQLSGGKTVENWRNIFVDGVAEFVPINCITPLIGNEVTPLLPERSVISGDEIEISFCSKHVQDAEHNTSQVDTAIYKFIWGQGSVIFSLGNTQAPVPTSDTDFYVKIVIYNNCKCEGVWYKENTNDDLAVSKLTLRRYR